MFKIKEWLAKKNPKFIINWDYKVPTNNFFGTQEEWNQNIFTKINELSAQIHMSTHIGPADTLEVNQTTFNFLSGLEAYTLCRISHRFHIIINNDMKNDTISVYRQADSHLIEFVRARFFFGIINIINKN